MTRFLLPLTVLLLAWPALAGLPPRGPQGPLPTEGYVASVYDGDTLTLESGDKIRVRWVNAPELKPPEPLAKEARQLTYDMVYRQRVALAVAAGGRDSYGRVVAGVSTEGHDLSLALLEAGLAHVFIIPPDSTDLAPLLAAQDRARAARRGIWATDGYQAPLHMTSFHANAPGDDATNVNGEYLRIANISPGPVDLSVWSLRNSRGDTYKLPQVTVPTGHTVRVHAGKGADASDPTNQIVVHLNSETPVFDDEQGRVELLGPDGRAVDVRGHGAE